MTSTDPTAPEPEPAPPDDGAAGAAAPPAGGGAGGAPAPADQGDLEDALVEVLAQRDQYLDALQRVKAEFDNYKKRTAREHAELSTRAASQLVAGLLPVLDACDAAVAHGADDVEPVRKALIEALGRDGLERMAPVGEPFDPNLHEAVLHEPGEDGPPTVVDELRSGYLWHGQVLRPAMVKVRG